MRNSESVIQFPQRTRLLCSKCGATGQMNCGCGVEYVKAAEFAARVVADPANVGKSDRQLAEEIGVSDKTVAKARRQTTAEKSAVETRTGRDGKTRRMPKAKEPQPKVEPKVTDKMAQAIEMVAPLIEAGLPVKARALSEKHPEVGSHYVFEAATAAVAYAKQHPAVDASTLPKTAQEKLASAERQMRHRLEGEYKKRHAGLDEEVRQRVLKEGKAYRDRMTERTEAADATEIRFREFMDQQTKILTRVEFLKLQQCVIGDNPDSSSPERRKWAAQLLNEKRFALTGEKK